MPREPIHPPAGGQPTHIILFRQPGAQNVSRLSAHLHVGEAKGVRLRSSLSMLDEKHGVNPKVFEHLAAGVASLNEDEVQKVLADDEVEAVFLNERRTLTRTQAASASASPTAHPPLGWPLSLLGMDGVPDHAGGSGVKVAVLDTGLDLSHPDLHQRVVEGDTAVSFVEGESVQDGNGHGTHCAISLCGPRSTQGSCRCGVAPDVSLLAGKVLNNAGIGWDDQILDGMDWAAEKGASVIAMSLGSRRIKGRPFAAAYERVASRLLADGVLVVAAAGNRSRRPRAVRPVQNPAACPSILAVAAVDEQRQIARFSCGRTDDVGEVNLSAPGVAVYSGWTGGGYKKLSGTSMAVPHVAGVAALLRQQHPQATGQELWNLIISLALPLGDPQDFGHGLVQLGPVN